MQFKEVRSLITDLCHLCFASLLLRLSAHVEHPFLQYSLTRCFQKCSSSTWWNQLRHSWISLICGWFKCLIISPPRSGPHQSLYSQSNLITLTYKDRQIHLASPGSTAFHWCEQPMWGLVQMLSWSGFQNGIHSPNMPLIKNGESVQDGWNPESLEQLSILPLSIWRYINLTWFF